MLKISVRPLAIRNSSMPYCTPFRVEMMTSSSTVALQARALHLADGRQDRVPVSTLATTRQPHPVFSSSNGSLARAIAERRDVHGLEELVIVGAHESLAAVEHVELHALELRRDLAGSVDFASAMAATSIRISLTARG